MLRTPTAGRCSNRRKEKSKFVSPLYSYLIENINKTLGDGHLVFTLRQKKNYKFYNHLAINCEFESLEFAYKYSDDIDGEHYFVEIRRDKMAEAQLNIYSFIDQFNTEIGKQPKPT